LLLLLPSASSLKDSNINDHPKEIESNKNSLSSNDTCNDINPPELTYGSSMGNSLLYGLPSVIPRLYSNAGNGAHSSEDVAAVARFSAAAAASLSGVPGAWPPFLGHHHPPGTGSSTPGCGTLPFGCGSPSFPPSSVSFPLFATPLGFHPLELASAMRLSQSSLPATSDLNLKSIDPRVLSACIGDLSSPRLTQPGTDHNNVPISGVPTTTSGNSELNNVRSSTVSDSISPMTTLSNSHAASKLLPELQESHDFTTAALAFGHQAERLKAAAAAAASFGHRFFPYGIRSYLINHNHNAQPFNQIEGTGPLSPANSLVGEKHSINGRTSASPVSTHHDSMSPLSNNNCSPHESSVTVKADRIDESETRRSNSGSNDRSTVPELKNIERMVEGLHSNDRLFVPTTVT